MKTKTSILPILTICISMIKKMKKVIAWIWISPKDFHQVCFKPINACRGNVPLSYIRLSVPIRAYLHKLI